MSLRGPEEWTEFGGLQSGLSVQHRGADLHRQQQPAAGRRRPRVPANRPGRRGSGPGARPDPLPDRQPGPQPDLSSPIDPHIRDFTIQSYNTDSHMKCIEAHSCQKNDLMWNNSVGVVKNVKGPNINSTGLLLSSQSSMD